MMENKCPNCGRVLEYDIDTGSLFCSECCMFFEIEQFETDTFVQQEKQTTKFGDSAVYIENEDYSKFYNKEVCRCTNCEAKFLFTEGNFADMECAYCGSKALVYDGMYNCVKPSYYLPITIDEKKAKKLFKKSILNDDRKNMKLNCVYVPLKKYNLKYEYIDKYYDIELNGDNVLACVSSKIDDKCFCDLYGIEELFDSNEYSTNAIGNVSYYVDCSYDNKTHSDSVIFNKFRDRCRCRMAFDKELFENRTMQKNLELMTCNRKNVKWYSALDNANVDDNTDSEIEDVDFDEKIDCRDFEFVMMPVWVATGEDYNSYLGLVNANTGYIYDTENYHNNSMCIMINKGMKVMALLALVNAIIVGILYWGDPDNITDYNTLVGAILLFVFIFWCFLWHSEIENEYNKKNYIKRK